MLSFLHTLWRVRDTTDLVVNYPLKDHLPCHFCPLNRHKLDYGRYTNHAHIHKLTCQGHGRLRLHSLTFPPLSPKSRARLSGTPLYPRLEGLPGKLRIPFLTLPSPILTTALPEV
jgi:hypothetical protein